MSMLLCKRCFDCLRIRCQFLVLTNIGYQSNVSYQYTDHIIQRTNMPRSYVTTSAQPVPTASYSKTIEKKNKKGKQVNENTSRNEPDNLVFDVTKIQGVDDNIILDIYGVHPIHDANSVNELLEQFVKHTSEDLEEHDNCEADAANESAEPVQITKKKPLSKQALIKLAEKEEQRRKLLLASKKLSMEIKLRSYIDVCLYLGEHQHSHNAVMLYLKRGNSARKCYPKFDNVSIFNSLLSYAAGQANLSYMKSLLTLMETEKIPLDWYSYTSQLEALGRQKELNHSDLQLQVTEVLEAMKRQGFLPEEIFQKTIMSKKTKEIIFRLLQDTCPTLTLLNFTYPEGYTPSCLLNRLKCDKEQSAVVESSINERSLENVREFATIQFDQESQHSICVKSIQKPSENKEGAKFVRQKLAECEEKWRGIVTSSFELNLKLLESAFRTQKACCVYPYLKVLPVSKYVDLIMHEIRELAEQAGGVGFGISYNKRSMGTKVMLMHMMQLKQDKEYIETLKSVYFQYLKYTVDKDLAARYTSREYWQHLLQSNNVEHFQFSSDSFWPYTVLCDVGGFLYQIIMNEVRVNTNILNRNTQKENVVPAFFLGQKDEGVKPHPVVEKLYREARIEELWFNTTMMPMLSPPIPWINIEVGGFLFLPPRLVRITRSSMQWNRLQNETPTQQLYPIFDSLNNLSMCSWKINQPLLDLIIQVFNSGGCKELTVPVDPSDLPPRPTVSRDLTGEDRRKAFKAMFSYRKQKKEMYSLWCDALYKLSIANYFRDNVFWFPHNMDFRGRTYPTPPHFNHLGSDMIRSILLFANGKPLGKHGLDWIKVHLINLTGLKKRASNELRLAYANEILPDILDSADNPFTGKGWWKSSDEPWQTLACCMEIAQAIRTGNPEKYISHYPVHQDGSCNGLQHYAALGRDIQGAQQVNLAPHSVPQDVYSGVAARVEQERAKDAAEGVEIARILEGCISRKVVKQTVMTVVYGVTRFGARLQILKRLKEIPDFPPEHLWKASQYLVKTTFLSIGEIFTNTSVIQRWLTDCAIQICRVQQKPVEWVTPLGLPVVQPYLKYDSFTLESRFAIGIPNVVKQKNAFPPNYIHSLDSTHMMLTSLACKRNSVDFAAVHDCYWTHPSSVDQMSRICREQFVALHSEPLLEDLSRYLYEKLSVPQDQILNNGRKADKMKTELNEVLKRVPKPGEFQIEEVLKSTYFFS